METPKQCIDCDEECKLCNKYECECETEFSCNICNTDVITNIVNHEFKCDECREKDDEEEACHYCDNTDDMTAYQCEKCEKKCCGDCAETMSGDSVAICNKCAEIYEDDAEWAECYGINTTKTKVYIMAGGGDHWWNYVVDFDDEHGEQLIVYKQDKSGMTEQYEKRLAYRHKINLEELRLVPLDWQPAEDKDEGLVTY
jgi:hypothetical protein